MNAVAVGYTGDSQQEDMIAVVVGARGRAVQLHYNASLPQCDAQAVSDAVTPLDFTGQIEVTGNQGTCP